MLRYMTDTAWWTYVDKLIGSDTAQEAARRAGFDKSAFTRWKKGAKADPEFAVKLARGYGANVIEALAAAGLITEEEAALREVHVGRRELLQQLTDKELADEQKRRADHTVVRLEAGMTRSEVDEQMRRAIQMGLLFEMPGDQLPLEAEGLDLAFDPSKVADLLQSDHDLARRISDEPKGPDPRGLDDGEE